MEQARLFVLEPVGWVSAFGIDMLRYELTICHGTLINISYEFSNKTFEEDPFYYNEIEGFLNVTALNQAPVFLSYHFPSDIPDLYSNGNFYGAFAEWWQKIDGMNPIRERDITLIDIEPITGKGMYHNNLCIFLYVPVLRAWQRMQINVYIGDPQPKYFDAYNMHMQRKYGCYFVIETKTYVASCFHC